MCERLGTDAPLTLLVRFLDQTHKYIFGTFLKYSCLG